MAYRPKSRLRASKRYPILGQQGFSLLALIGTLAVLSIGLAVAAPALIQISNQQHQETEDKQLRRIARGIHTFLEQNQAFPPSLASLVPDYVPFTLSQVTINAHGFPRYYATHPTMVGFNNRSGLTAAELTNARFILVSNLAQDAAPVITNIAQFEAWWSADETLTPGLHLHRGNIGHSFYSFTITPEGNGASYFISSNPPTDSSGGLLPLHQAYHLVGTLIGLDESTVYTAPEVQFALTTNTAYWFNPNCSSGKQWNPVLTNCLTPIVLYTFEEGTGTTVNDVSGVGPPLNLTVANGAATSWVPGGLFINSSTIVESAAAATKVITAITTSHAMTVEAWIRPANVTQDGPARIVTLSQTITQRNFTVGQGRWGSNPPDVFDFRLRTTTQNNNGVPSITSPSGTATTLLTHIVNTRDSSGAANIYVNGVLQTSGTFGGNLSNWNTGYKLGLANEFSLDRPWLGEFHRVAIYDFALSSSQVAQRFAAGAN